MSKSKSKQTEQQTTSGTATTTPNTPDWLLSPIQQNVGGIAALMNSGQPLVSGASPLQQQAYSAAMGLTPQTVPQAPMGKSDIPMVNGGPGDGYSPPTPAARGGGMGDRFDLATMLTLGGGLGGAMTTGPAAQASSEGFTREGLQTRLSPYLQEVVDTSLADFDYGAGQARARQVASAAVNGGMRNSNNALRAGELDAGLQRGRGTLAATARDQGFRSAADILSQDNNRSAQTSALNAQMANQMQMFNASQGDNALNRLLQAGGSLAGIGSAAGANTRANIGLQADLGNQQREIANGQSEAARLAGIQALLQGVPYDAIVGRTVNQTGNMSGTGTSTQSGFNLASMLSPISWSRSAGFGLG
jgi:hypothetical protein